MQRSKPLATDRGIRGARTATGIEANRRGAEMLFADLQYRLRTDFRGIEMFRQEVALTWSHFFLKTNA